MCFHGNDVLCFVSFFFFFGQNLYDLVHLQEDWLGFRVVKVLEVVFLLKCRMYDLGYFSSFFGGRGLIFINSLRSCSMPVTLQPLFHLIKQSNSAGPSNFLVL